MKVLEYPEMDWKAEVVCSFCKARLLVETGDVQKEGYSKKYYVHCPVCGSMVYSTEVLPWYVMRCAENGFVGWPPGQKPKRSY